MRFNRYEERDQRYQEPAPVVIVGYSMDGVQLKGGKWEPYWKHFRSLRDFEIAKHKFQEEKRVMATAAKDSNLNGGLARAG